MHTRYLNDKLLKIKINLLYFIVDKWQTPVHSPLLLTTLGHNTFPVFNFQAFHENNETWRRHFPDYHSYLLWKASLNYPSNSLSSFLALRVEQHSESSSYRKGLVIPRYEPASEASVCGRSGGATSPVSERSGRSEAGRKISAVAKTVGLSIYLTNKRKSSYKKDN